MKKFFNLLKGNSFVVSIVLVMLAILTGGAAMAVTGGEAQPESPGSAEESNPDPVNPETNNRETPDGEGGGQSLPGTQASATQLREGGLVKPEYDEDIVKFRPDEYVLLNLARTMATQRTKKGYEAKHFLIGRESLLLNTKSQITAGEDGTITLNTSNTSGNIKLAYKGKLIFVNGVMGYKEGSATETDGDLVLFVMSNNGVSVKCQALNGAAATPGTTSYYLYDKTCPTIPANTSMVIGTIAGCESQMIVTPDNSQPRDKTVYLQKQIFNVEITDHEKEVLKWTPWALAELKENALEIFSQGAEYTLWKGKQMKWKMQMDENGKEEFAYSSEGILRQITNTLGLPGKFEFKNITDIGKIMFTEFAERKEAVFLVGKDLLADIINMDYTRHKEISYTQKKTDYGIVVNALVSNFGELDIIYAPALDHFGMADCGVVLDIKSARYYTNIKKREYNVDEKKTGNMSREASRYIYIEAGALALRGYNSLLVGPSEKIIAKNLSTSSKSVLIVDSLPETAPVGTKILFDEDTTIDGVTYSADKVYIKTNNGWEEYTGVI